MSEAYIRGYLAANAKNPYQYHSEEWYEFERGRCDGFVDLDLCYK